MKRLGIGNWILVISAIARALLIGSYSSRREAGQAIIILLLVMLISLSIGVAITQRSTSDVSTSTQSEQSQRAFSAAEAGIERALQNSLPTQTLNLSNDTQAQVTSPGLLPVPGSTIGIEYPPVGKETTTQFWLTDLTWPYVKNNFEVWFGNSDKPFNSTDNIAPAIEVNVISKVGSDYRSFRYYFDSDSTRALQNNFNTCTPSSAQNKDTILTSGSKFYCSATIPPASPCKAPCTPFTAPGSLVRVRLLYSNLNQKIALFPTSGAFLPPQVELYNSLGKAGKSQIALQVFRTKDLVPPWFDFAIFSVNSIKK